MAAGAAASDAKNPAVEVSAAVFLIAEMDKAGLPGDRIAEILRALGPGRALMTGSAVLHAIVSAAGGNKPDDPNHWAPNNFDVFFPTSREATNFARKILEARPDLERVDPSPYDEFYWNIDGDYRGKTAVEILRNGDGSPIRLIGWNVPTTTAIRSFDFPVLRAWFDGVAAEANRGTIEMIRAKSLYPDDQSVAKCSSEQEVVRLAGRLEKYSARGFGAWPAEIRYRGRGFTLTGISVGPLPETHPLHGRYNITSFGPGSEYTSVLVLTLIPAGRQTKAAH